MAHLHEALVVTGRADARVVERIVGGPHEATTLRMHGSPTILIDGHDPFAVDGEPPSFSCRLFQAGDRLEGAPSVDTLVALLRPPTTED
jgi:hypothetical protein